MFFLCLAEEFSLENTDQMGALVFIQDDEHIGAQTQDGDDAAGQDTSIAEVIIAKNRHGSTGTVQMGWLGQYTKFTTLSEESE